MCKPVGALAIGGLAGVLSVLGYKYLTVIGSFFALNACEKNGRIGWMIKVSLVVGTFEKEKNENTECLRLREINVPRSIGDKQWFCRFYYSLLIKVRVIKRRLNDTT